MSRKKRARVRQMWLPSAASSGRKAHGQLQAYLTVREVLFLVPPQIGFIARAQWFLPV